MRSIVFALLMLAASSGRCADDCFKALELDTELSPIKDKVSLVYSDSQTFSMLANDAIPTLDETQVIYIWATKREQCFKSDPRPSPITQTFNSVQSLILDLYKGGITYGQFAMQRQEVMKQYRQQTLQLLQQMQQQQSQQQLQQQGQEEYLYQACLNRARNQAESVQCGWERSGRQLGGALSK